MQINLKPYLLQDRLVKLGHGRDGTVYRISRDLAAKTIIKPGDEEWAINCTVERKLTDLAKEYTFGSYLRENQVNVARPEGLFNIQLRNEARPAYVMEYLEGLRLTTLQNILPRTDYKNIENKFFEQIEKARQTGVIIEDDGPHNAIWSAQDDKVYIIDFAVCNFPHGIIPIVDIRYFEENYEEEAA